MFTSTTIKSMICKIPFPVRRENCRLKQIKKEQTDKILKETKKIDKKAVETFFFKTVLLPLQHIAMQDTDRVPFQKQALTFVKELNVKTFFLTHLSNKWQIRM